VRTAVGGHSHEQVASDLGITDGAVRGLLYRARATLRTAVTALTPVSWLAGRAEQGAPVSERLSELAAGGGTAGLGGLLLKGTAVAVTAGTLLTGAAVVQLQAHHAHRKLAAAPPHSSTSAATREARATATTTSPAPIAPSHRDRTTAARNSVRIDIGRDHASPGGAPGVRHLVASAPPRSPATAPRASAPSPSAPVDSTQIVLTTPSSSSTPSGGAGQTQAGSNQSGASQGGGPVGSSSSSSTETASSTGSGEAPASSEGESAGGSQPSSEGSGAQGQSAESGSSSGTQSGGLVGTVVHEVGSLLEHVLH